MGIDEEHDMMMIMVMIILSKITNNILLSNIEIINFRLMRLVWFYGTSTIIGYLMLNAIFTYILNI